MKTNQIGTDERGQEMSKAKEQHLQKPVRHHATFRELNETHYGYSLSWTEMGKPGQVTQHLGSLGQEFGLIIRTVGSH